MYGAPDAESNPKGMGTFKTAIAVISGNFLYLSIEFNKHKKVFF